MSTRPIHVLIAAGALWFAPTLAAAQSSGRGALTDAEIQHRIAQSSADFDYLLGDWKFTAQSREFGEYKGVWSAVRLEGGHILDEFRVVGDSGETYYSTVTIRMFNALENRWDMFGAEPGAGALNAGTAKRVGDEMHIVQTFGTLRGKPFTRRMRYHNIGKNSFSWVSEPSNDGGKTWTIAATTIQATRVAGPRNDLTLTTAKRPTTP